MRALRLGFVLGFCTVALAMACSASGDSKFDSTAGAGGDAGAAGFGGQMECDVCSFGYYIPCVNGQPGPSEQCADVCVPGVGCLACAPGSRICVGNEVHLCAADGMGAGELVEVCDAANGSLCTMGNCAGACEVASGQPSNVGCEFWAVDLDQQDAINDPASAPWGVVLSNAGESQANITIELNAAPVGQPPQPEVVHQVSINAGDLHAVVLPTRELDCGIRPNDYNSPGTCLSSNAFRISASSPIVVYQFNVFENAFSNDASLLLPSNALGRIHRIIGWPAGHPVRLPIGNILDRSYVTVVGTRPNTQVRVRPSWRIRGNPPIAPTPAGGDISVTIGPYDVLNLETDDATLADDPNWATDLTGTAVEATQPVAVFSGVETTSTPGGVDIPTYPGWTSEGSCCLDHLEDQMFPVESIGANYLIPRSPVRSTSGFREPDVLRFLGVAEPATVTTSLAPPFDSFTLQPGQVVNAWAQDDVVVTATAPVMVGQLLISQTYVDGPYIGDPALTIFPPVDQFRTEYVILTPSSWVQDWVVITAEVGASVTLDGLPTDTCMKEAGGTLLGVTYESRRCPVAVGVHRLTGDKPFGIVAYGYGRAGSYAFVGGADVKRIYDPPPIL